MLSLGALQILAFLADPAEQMFERITPQAAVEQLAACGLPGASIRYDEELQQEVLTLTVAAPVSDETLACADKAVSFYALELPADLQPRYEKLRDPRTAALSQQQAERWLAKRGLLSKLPSRAEVRRVDAALALRLEGVCGPQAKGALRAAYGLVTLNMDWLERSMEPNMREAEVMTCLLHAIRVTGVQLAFFGNEVAPAAE
ncbi:MAG TPA: hypothetical protein VIA98_05055 [Allosphingosinicella sp.]|jgi:hypothetical protein